MNPERRSEILAEHRFLTREKRRVEDRLNELSEIIRLFNLKEAA